MLRFILLCTIGCFVNAEIEDGVAVLVGAGKSDCFFRDLKVGDRMDLEVQVYILIYIFLISDVRSNYIYIFIFKVMYQ